MSPTLLLLVCSPVSNRFHFSTVFVNNRCKMGLPCAVHAPFSGFAPELGQSSSDKRVHFGLRTESAREIEIRWLSGFHQIIRDVKADQSVIETESARG